MLKDYQQSFSSPQVNRSGTTATSNNTIIGQNNVEVKFASPDKMDVNTALVIVDGEKMMAIEFDEKEKEKKNNSSFPAQSNLFDSIRFATHTNSESSIISHISIFERLWMESEMNEKQC